MKVTRVSSIRSSVRREQVVGFGVGLIVGILFTVLWKRLDSFDSFFPAYNGLNNNSGSKNYRVYVVKELQQQQQQQQQQQIAENHHDPQHTDEHAAVEDALEHGGHTNDMHVNPDAHDHSESEHVGGLAGRNITGEHVHDDEENHFVSQTLFDNVRILCWIMTGPQNHESKARHVKATWAKRCNKYVFMSSAVDDTLPSIKINVSEGRNALWGKTKRAYQWCYDNHLRDYDWFLKADDDTYVVVENLRYLLSNYSASDPIYFGKRFKPFTKQGYMSGGAGYVLSREALRRFIEVGLNTNKPDPGCKAKDDTGAEDAEMGKCLFALDVKAGDALDDEKRSKFFPFSLEHHLTHKHDPDFWYWKYTYDDEKPGFDCCSDFAISFHYITPNQMYLYDFLIYHLRPFGVTYQYTMPLRVAALAQQHQQVKQTNITAQNKVPSPPLPS